MTRVDEPRGLEYQRALGMRRPKAPSRTAGESELGTIPIGASAKVSDPNALGRSSIAPEKLRMNTHAFCLAILTINSQSQDST